MSLACGSILQNVRRHLAKYCNKSDEHARFLFILKTSLRNKCFNKILLILFPFFFFFVSKKTGMPVFLSVTYEVLLKLIEIQ